MTYKIDVQYLEHDGGTKFYETVLIQEDGGPGMLIKRYGSIDKKMGGGATIIERGSHSVVAASANKILTEKRKPRGDKGQYKDAPRLSFGLHQVRGLSISNSDLTMYVTQHYNRADSDAIKSYFGVGGAAAEVVKEEPAAFVSEEPVIRDASWGSW